MDGTNWVKLKKVLKEYGNAVSGEMRDTLMDQGHIDTGKLWGSIKPYTEFDEDRHFLYVSFEHYGQYADRWFKKGTRTLDIPTFVQPWYDNVGELNDLIGDAARDDIQENINDFVREYNNR